VWFCGAERIVMNHSSAYCLWSLVFVVIGEEESSLKIEIID
jgi:hypothetical protein